MLVLVIIIIIIIIIITTRIISLPSSTRETNGLISLSMDVAKVPMLCRRGWGEGVADAGYLNLL